MEWPERVARAAAGSSPAWHPLAAEHLAALAAEFAAAPPPAGALAAAFAAMAPAPAACRAVVLAPAPGAAAAAVGADAGEPFANWAEQGVLMLCAALGPAGGPAWSALVDAVVAAAAAAARDCVFLFWDHPACQRAHLVDPHPRGHRVWVSARGLPQLAAAGFDLRLRVPLLELYTDGSRPGTNARGAPGRAGAAWVMLSGPGAAALEGPGAPAGPAPCAELPVPGAQTNQRAELEAMRQALLLAARTRWARAEVYTDSRYARALALGEWQPKANLRLAAAARRAYLAAAAQGPVAVVHMRGHGRARGATARQRRGNDLADAAANRAARQK